ncbi:DUF2490 domain-containing protein [Pontibacter roseus]|uniref:DUF2490 domain-containing protein n=1 Tax=Pontibacter roseus TaxID=336989 RepID=UPI0014616974|nr:DUF2490 domain-containing protein [Pontibacter roseus]
MKKLYLLLLLATGSLLAQAQSKISAPTALWPELQVSYGLGESGQLFLQNQYRINTDRRYNDLKQSGFLSNFERIQLAVGYEHTFTERWRAGGLFRYALEDFPETSFLTGYLRHTGSIKSLFFTKQLMLEYIKQEERDAYGRGRLMAELGKRLSLGSRFITPSLSYELFVNSQLGQAASDAEERTIDRTRLQLNFTYELTEKLRINPYFLRQTDYYYVQVPPKYDENEVLVEEGYITKRNRISPVIGLQIKYTLNTLPVVGSYTY